MAVTQRIDLRQAQTLVMTPQLQQAIKLLELSNQDLVAYVETGTRAKSLARSRATTTAAEKILPSARKIFPQWTPIPESSAETIRPHARHRGVQCREESMPDAKDSPLDTDYENTYSSAPQEGMAGGDAL